MWTGIALLPRPGRVEGLRGSQRATAFPGDELGDEVQHDADTRRAPYVGVLDEPQVVVPNDPW